MADLKSRILGIQVKNFESRWYVPGKELDKLFSQTVVEEAVSKCDIKPYKRKEVAERIVKGAKKTFAVLVMIGKEMAILNFIEHDHFQDPFLDSKLPFQRPELSRILDVDSAEAFYRAQWMVTVPLFCNDMSHRCLHEDVILPFTKSTRIGSGAFGTVFELHVDSKHQSLQEVGEGSVDLRLVRKEIVLPAPEGTDEVMKVREDEPPGKEGHILSHLRLIRHPNVVRLIALYSYRGSLHLLFPRARSDLAKFLSSSERPIGLQTNLSIVLAMQGLCGAVASLHRFVVPEFNLHMKGYHHDLKPENILVDDTEFLLSDFGLSTLKDVEANSKTLFKEVMGYYIAPECQSIEDGFKKNLIGQSSDIWALGCIIAVILTYMLHGATGVEEFESKRKAQVLNWTTYQFHSNGALNPGVDAWLTHLANNEDPIGAEFSAVVRDMLRIDPDTRPNAQQVLSSVNSLAARSLFRSTERQFKRLARKLNDLCVDVEHERFIVFAQAIGLDNARRDNARLQALTESSEFHSLRVQFENLQEILNATVDTLQTPQTSSFIQRDLRSCVDGLWNLLPRGTRLRCERILERRLISTSDLNLLRGIQDSFKERPQYRNIGLLAAMKYMKKLVDNDQVQNQALRWAPGSILALGLKVNHQANIARVLPKDATEEKEALIEWIEYDDQWRNDVGEELFLRVEAIAELLSKTDKPTGFRGLDCTGYFHKSSRHSFGLIFDLPMLAAGQTQGEFFAPCSLLSLIEKIRNLELRPSLGDKFQLANNIATSVYEWHKADWLHKAISSFNVIVFPGAFQSEAACITMPFIIGFNHCRPDEPNAVSLGPPEHPDQMDYSHPGYLKNRSRYRREYDYYSLGIVLLEIGLWKSLRSLAAEFNADDQSPEQLREFLLEHHVARLHTRMGMVYQNAVRMCLTFDTSKNPHTTRTTSIDVLDIFENEVVTPLGKCFA